VGVEGRSGNWSWRERQEWRGFTVEWMDQERVLLSRRNALFEAASLEESPRLLGRVDMPLWRAAVSRVRLGQRLLRSMFYNAVPLDDGRVFVTFNCQAGFIEDGRYCAVEGFHRPCRVLRKAVAKDTKGDLFFGEYLSNAERGPMRIYRLAAGSSQLEVVYTFAAGAIRHIHGIYFDPVGDALWCLTGDLGEEARILRSCDGFQTVELVGSGDESWRAVSAVFTAEAIFYAMDAEFTQNKLFRLDRTSGERREIGDVDGPVYYSHQCGSELFFAVTAELCPSQVGKSATLWRLDGEDLSPLMSFEKDAWSRYLMYGTLHLPAGPGRDDSFALHGVSLNGAGNRCIEVRRLTGSTE